MKKHYNLPLLSVAFIALISWGAAGHRIIAAVAQKHLEPSVHKVIKAYLDGQEMTDVASWADEVRGQPEYRSTASWHFLNLPLGLSYEEFQKQVLFKQEMNISVALTNNERILADLYSPPEKKTEALKFIIHLVGDAHQPMHISRKEDMGGNTIQVRFDGKGTNLHSLWDSKLIDHEHLSDADIFAACDKASPEQIKQWQGDPPIKWLWESYQISSQLYKDIESNNNIDEAYYNKYIKVIHQRINQAGIRLAGELNRIFKDQQVKIKITNVVLSPPPLVHQTAGSTAVEVELKDLSNMIGKEVIVQGKVYGNKVFSSMTLVNLGAAYPNQLATLVLKGDATTIAPMINGKTVKVMGTVIAYRGKPEIVITNADQLLGVH